MKTQITALSAVALLALTACGNGDTDQEQDTASADDERVTELEATVEQLQTDLDTLAGEVADMEAEAESEPATGGTDTDSEADADEDEDEPDAEGAYDAPAADTGGEAEIGEPVAISGWGDGLDMEQAGTITLNDVEVGYTNDACHDAPINDHYLALNLTVEADADAYEEIAATVFNFYLIDDQNTMHRDEVQTMEAYSCQSASGALDWVPPGTNHTGYIILDTDLTEGTIVYEGVGEDVAWEF